LWSCISLVCRTSHGRISFLMRSSRLLKYLQKLFMRQVDLHISKRVMRHKLLVCRCLSPIKRAPEGSLQQQSKHYLHPGWKGSHFLHQQSKFRTRASGHCMIRGLQESKRQISFSFRMMTLIWAHKAQSLRRSFRSNRRTLIFVPQLRES